MGSVRNGEDLMRTDRAKVEKPRSVLLSKLQPELISVTDAEALTGVSRWTWRSYAYSGRIESIKIGTRLLLPLAEVRRVLNEGRRPRVDGLPAGAPSVRRATVQPITGESHVSV